MAYHDITDPSYNDQLRMFETSDPVHADVYNAVAEQLILNDVAIRNGVGLSDLEEYVASIKFMIQLDNGPAVIPLASALEIIVPANAGARNAIYGGRYLGDHVTDEQWAEIKNGTFRGMLIGDYWTIDVVNWRIAAFDYWYHYGDTECTKHHIVIVPDTNLLAGDGSTTHWMNKTDITTGAYVGSDFYTGNNGNTGKAQCRTKAQNAFGAAHILTHREHLQNAVTNGYESAGTWYDSDIEIMTERMVYGCDIFHNVIHGTNIPNFYSIDTSQLPLFALDHSRICNRASWWLRDVASATHFAFVSHAGTCDYGGASGAWVGVRPAFGIYQS